MKKWRELVFGGIITIVIIGACAIVPVAFYHTIPPAELPAATENVLPDIEYGTLSREERARLFLANNGELISEGTVTSINSSELGFTTEQYARVNEVFDRALNKLVLDGDPRTLAFNTISCYNYYFYIADNGNGKGIRYLNLYMEWRTDWNSWFTVNIDVDTGDIYHIFYSASCIANLAKYSDVVVPDSVSLLESVVDMNKSNRPKESVMVEKGITTYLCVLNAWDGNAPYTYSYIHHVASLVDFKATIQYSDDVSELVLMQ